MPIDEWYRKPVEARAKMVATIRAKNAIDWARYEAAKERQSE